MELQHKPIRYHKAVSCPYLLLFATTMRRTWSRGYEGEREDKREGSVVVMSHSAAAAGAVVAT